MSPTGSGPTGHLGPTGPDPTGSMSPTGSGALPPAPPPLKTLEPHWPRRPRRRPGPTGLGFLLGGGDAPDPTVSYCLRTFV